MQEIKKKHSQINIVLNHHQNSKINNKVWFKPRKLNNFGRIQQPPLPIIINNEEEYEDIGLTFLEETGTDRYQEFWVNNEQEIIEIEIPSLNSFTIILYYFYTSNNTKLFKVAKLEENLCI
ncbi:hypothetical protein H8356DRAFT_1341283 [Neocallimastix lanati (nom. inval.)]|nr:hypothetical protein H8356DRAFT_1341283 [Neocallimastix sp. JGI-2020a]